MKNIRLNQRASEHVRLLNCPHCNAPLDYSLGETLFTCKYCGYTFSIIKEGKYKEIAPSKHFMLANEYSEKEMREVIHDWMREDWKPEDLVEGAEITEMELRFVPIWLVNVTAETSYHGKKRIETVERRVRETPTGERKPSRPERPAYYGPPKREPVRREPPRRKPAGERKKRKLRRKPRK